VKSIIKTLFIIIFFISIALCGCLKEESDTMSTQYDKKRFDKSDVIFSDYSETNNTVCIVSNNKLDTRFYLPLYYDQCNYEDGDIAAKITIFDIKTMNKCWEFNPVYELNKVVDNKYRIKLYNGTIDRWFASSLETNVSYYVIYLLNIDGTDADQVLAMDITNGIFCIKNYSEFNHSLNQNSNWNARFILEPSITNVLETNGLNSISVSKTNGQYNINVTGIDKDVITLTFYLFDLIKNSSGIYDVFPKLKELNINDKTWITICFIEEDNANKILECLYGTDYIFNWDNTYIYSRYSKDGNQHSLTSIDDLYNWYKY